MPDKKSEELSKTGRSKRIKKNPNRYISVDSSTINKRPNAKKGKKAKKVKNISNVLGTAQPASSTSASSTPSSSTPASSTPASSTPSSSTPASSTPASSAPPTTPPPTPAASTTAATGLGDESDFLPPDQMTDWNNCNIYYKSSIVPKAPPIGAKTRMMPAEKKIIKAINDIYTPGLYQNIEAREKQIEKIFNTIVYYIMMEPPENFPPKKDKKGKPITRDDIMSEIINKTARYINQTILKRDEYGIHKPADNYLKINDELKNGTAVDTGGVSGGSRGNIETGHTNAQCKNGAVNFPYSMSDERKTDNIKPNSKPPIQEHTPNRIIPRPHINFPVNGEDQTKYSIPRYDTDQGFKLSKYQNSDGTLKYDIQCYQCLFNLTHGDGINNDGCQCEHKKAIGQNAVTEGLLLDAYYKASLIVLNNSTKNNNQLYRWSCRRQRVGPILVDHAHTACNYAKSNNSLILQKLSFQSGNKSLPVEITYADDPETEIQVNGLINLCLGLEGSKMLVNKSEKDMKTKVFKSKPQTSWAYVVGSKLSHPASGTDPSYLRCFVPTPHPNATNQKLYEDMTKWGEIYFPNKSTSGPSKTVGAKITSYLSKNLKAHVKYIIGELEKGNGKSDDMGTNECTLCSLVVNFYVIFLNTKKPPLIGKMSPNIINALKKAIELGYQVRNLPSTASKRANKKKVPNKKKTSKKKIKQKGGVLVAIPEGSIRSPSLKRPPDSSKGYPPSKKQHALSSTKETPKSSLKRAGPLKRTATSTGGPLKRTSTFVKDNLPDELRNFLLDLVKGIPDETSISEKDKTEGIHYINENIKAINSLFTVRNQLNDIEMIFLEHYLKVYKHLKLLLLILDGFYKKGNNLYLADLEACKRIYQNAYKDSVDLEKKLVKLFRPYIIELRGGNIGRSPNLHGGTLERKSKIPKQPKKHKMPKNKKMTPHKYTKYLQEYSYKDTNSNLHQLDKYIADIYRNKNYLAYEEDFLSVESGSLEMSTKLDQVRKKLEPPILCTGWKFLGRECVHFIETLVDCHKYPKGMGGGGVGLYENFYKELSGHYNINNIYESNAPKAAKRKMKKKKKQTMKQRRKL